MFPILCCIDSVQLYKYLFFFYKEAFYGDYYSLIVGKVNWRGQSCFRFFFFPLQATKEEGKHLFECVV